MPRSRPLFGFRHRPIVNNRAVRPGARNGRETQIAKILALATKGLEPIAGANLGQAAFRRFAREPGEKPAQRRAVAAVGGPGAVDLDGVFACFWQNAWVGGAVNFGAGFAKPVKNPGSGARRVDLHSLALGGERVERRAQLLRRQDGYAIAEMAIETGRQFTGIDEKRDAGVLAQDRER